MARISSIVVGVAATAAIVAALVVALRMFGSSIVRMFRSDEDHPHWELLMQ